MNNRETVVGITAFLNKIQGFKAILKHRIDDFLVNEINLNGEIAKLTNFELPIPEIAESIKEKFKNPEAVLDAFSELVGRDGSQKLVPFIKKDGIDQEYKAVKLKPIQDKEQRRLIHDFFKNFLPGFIKLDTMTEENEENEKIIVIFPKDQMCRHDKRNDKYPGGKKKFLSFVLYKRNTDNIEALDLIARNLYIPISRLKIAGTKDKRGITSQRVTGYRMDAYQLLMINNKIRNIKVGNLSYCKHQAYIGDLLGNQFRIALRNIQSEDRIKALEACKLLKENGFINYFGLQRFGVKNPTHQKGAALLRGDWETAAYLILKDEITDESIDVTDIESLVKLRKKEMDEGIIKPSSNERKLLIAYEQNGYDEHLEAINSLPLKLKTMYVHAYQSYLWNMAVTKRIENYGLDKLLVGDLVIKNDTLNNSLLEIESKKRRANVHVVTEEDIENNKYTIYDLVLPMVSGLIRLPNNDTSNIFINLIEKDGLDLDHCNHDCLDFDLTRLSGDYRKVIVKPTEFEYEIVEIYNNNESLFVSDYEKLRREGLVPDDFLNDDDNLCPEDDHIDKKQKIDDISDIFALKLKFNLPPSAYATMLVRELTKMSTHSKDQYVNALD